MANYTRSRKNRSESGIGESERALQANSATFQQIHEESPRSPSTAVETISQGRAIEKSLLRISMAPPALLAPLEGDSAQPSTSQRTETTQSCRPPSPTGTVRSRRSTNSAIARIRLAEYEAEKQLAELEERRLNIQKNLIKRRLEANILAIEADEAATIDENEIVCEWIDRSQATNQPQESDVQPPLATEVRGEERMQQRGEGIEQLANVLEKMIHSRPPPRQTSDLPPFNGSIMEWLPFKAAMEDSTRLYKFSATENLLRLRNSLRGEAREIVLSQLYTATHPDLIMKTLEMKYGRPEYIVDKAMEDLKRLPRVGSSSGELNELAVKLQNIVYTMKSVDRRGYLQNPLLIRDVMEKLSPHLISKWAEHAAVNEERIARDNEITVLAEFLMAEADKLLRFTHTGRHGASGFLRRERPTTKRTVVKEKVFTTSEATREEQSVVCFRCKSTNHYTPLCPQLKKLTTNEVWKWAKEQRLCFRCMKRKHSRDTCQAKLCGVDGCKMPHHAILHKKTEIVPKEEEPCAEQSTPATVMNVATKSMPGTVLLKTCKVKLSGLRGEVITDALLDEGSTVTLIDEDLAYEIVKGGPKKPLKLKGINEDRRVSSATVKFHIQGVHEDVKHEITARTVKGLQLCRQRVPDNLTRYKHLRGVVRHTVNEDVKPRMLIGADNWHLIVSRQLRTGKHNEPAASRTLLGWVIHGSVPERIIMQKEESVLHVFTPASDLQLQRLVEKHFDVDSLGITNKTRVSENDKRAERILKETIKRKGDQFEVGLPWKTDNLVLPDSYEYALKRLRTLEKKMSKEPAFKSEYGKQVANLIDKGYAEECDGSEQASSVKWYLPHFAVVNINKPERVRMVFDAAARVDGVSLNDCLLEGPDLLASLTGILFGFREKKIAVTADIEEMFLRVKIRLEDQPAQMFLWRDGPNEKPRTFKMTSMIFGASCSPFLAHSVRNYNASEFEDEYPEPARAIKEKHYMDDYLDSFDDENKAVETIRDVMRIHERANFNLRGWNSNSTKVLESIPDVKRSKNSDVRLTAHQMEKTLGLRWNPREDTVGFNTDIKRVPEAVKTQRRVPTKREALSAVMSIYDPLGLISQYTVVGKIILQRLWLKKVQWDEELPSDEAEEFQQWVTGLEDISALALPRCYSMEIAPGSEVQLHVFNDASEQAFATTAYWRIRHEDGAIEVAHVMGKAKVAPLKLLTIPRLELQAAVIGARMASVIVKEHTWKPSKVVYWTDSKTVLHWIRNEDKKYTPFVAHRLAEIAELSHRDDWRWISTDDNVADDATRIGTRRISRTDRWFNGPLFLRTPEEEWPTMIPDGERCDEVVYSTSEGSTSDDVTLPDISRFSSYKRLIRATAMVRLFIERLKEKQRDIPLQVTHIKDAEARWIRQSQKESFGDELNRLKTKQPLRKNSKLTKLDPEIEDGILKARGRIGASTVTTHSNRPVILDGGHSFTRLLIDNGHRNAGHANNERVVNDLRQRFVIFRLRPTVRKIAKSCQFCRVYKATPRRPPKGDLPAERIDPGHRAFTYCGVDYFGPLTVTIGRRHEKRWCALFTCLTTRAVHLEIVPSLSTDSAIMALRRMAARRGWPRVIYSDNATNFRGADVELRDCYRKWIPELRNYCLQYETEWRFIPPGAPHMGGAWERLVRSVKAALSTTLKEKSPKEEVLQTLLTEAEYSINARPLTHVPVDYEEEEALTPNHFLMGSSTGLPRTGPCTEADRSIWRRSQAMADQFWRRWLREYLPTLIPRGQSRTEGPQLQPNDLVMIVDGTLPRNTWPRGIIVRVYPGPDGVVRAADVRTKGGVFRRPATKIAVLLRGEAAKSLRRGENVTDGLHHN
ncbi:uncharacterized protein LOC123653632 [Melitaea cinxia]|uniref:uncharacterized protein LOC123653632 n=1 Tax=Melitaea cinxia TaxID=113334 RepID=UPI001E274065|nr:uncharacterized protein LOC123653632 [Melitaea cinxia]